MTDPGERAPLLDALPSDPARLVAAVSGLVLHPLFVGPLGITPAPDSTDDMESRTVARMLDRVLARDAAPLDAVRPPERRFIGICRDYALLACAALRHHHVPARLRVGFAAYFTPGYLEDHWVCEHHAGDRWRLLGPELGPRVAARRGLALGVAPGAAPPEPAARRLDAVASLTSAVPPDWSRLRQTHDGDADFRVPPVVTSFTAGGPVQAAVDAA